MSWSCRMLYMKILQHQKDSDLEMHQWHSILCLYTYSVLDARWNPKFAFVETPKAFSFNISQVWLCKLIIHPQGCQRWIFGLFFRGKSCSIAGRWNILVRNLCEFRSIWVWCVGVGGCLLSWDKAHPSLIIFPVIFFKERSKSAHPICKTRGKDS